jgi:hypothetical protein
MRGGGWQLASGAVVGLVFGGGDEIPDRQEVVAGKILVRRHVGAGGRGVRCRSVAHPKGNRCSGITRSSMCDAAVSLVVHRVVRQRAQPDVVPSAHGESAGWSFVSVVVLKGPQRLLGWAPGHQQRTWREPILDRSTAMGGARCGW